MYRILPYLILLLFLGSCKIREKAHNGPTAYRFKEYSLAIPLLKQDFEKAKDLEGKRQIALQIADCYDQNNESAAAIPWLEKAMDLRTDADLIFKIGLLQKEQELYTEAIESFKKYISQGGEANPAYKQIDACEQALQWKEENGWIKVYPLNQVNSPEADYAAALMGKTRDLVFTSSRAESKGELIYGWTGGKYGDLYVAKRNGNEFDLPLPFPDAINTNFYEGSVCFNKEQNEMVFSRCGFDGTIDAYCSLMYSRLENGSWTEAVELKLFSDSCNLAHPCFSADGKSLFFSSDEKNGFGGKDIYYCKKTEEGWSEPYNAGRFVNTEGNEMYPYLDDSRKLYFASDGHPGMGGLDIFSSTQTDGNWGNIQNLKAPINSGYDDFALILEKTKPKNEADHILQIGYLSSNRKGGKGSDDIYRFQEEHYNTYTLLVKTYEKKYADMNQSASALLGYQLLPDAQIRLMDETGSALQMKDSRTDSGGYVRFELEEGKTYRISASRNGYFSSNEKQISTKGLYHYQKIEITLKDSLELLRIFPAEDIVINNIYYGLDSANLRPQSLPALDTLYALFKRNPGLLIEIGSHTDSRGSDAHNLDLSQRRAESVVNYLIGKGIPKEQLQAKGYGETRLVNECANNVSCDESKHQENRRTTFRIVSDQINIKSEK